MSYIVRWSPEAERVLADLWTAGPDRNAIAAAADEVDVCLSRDPVALGESRTGTRRLLFRGPLAFLIDVQAVQQIVMVLAVKRNSRQR